MVMHPVLTRKKAGQYLKTAYENAANAKADATTEELQNLLTALQDAKAN